MLVITRREGEEVVIGSPESPIGVVRIASIKGDRVRVAFEFPRDVQVHRREVADQITGEAEQSASRKGDDPVKRSDSSERHAPAGRDAETSNRVPAV
ncbi:MAG: carbon storage regulator [Planctomycetota bacterium]